MKYVNALIVVKDMERSKQFYREVLGLEVTDDFGANVMLSCGLFLQTADSWRNFIGREESEIAFGNNDVELYFEEDDIERFYVKLKKLDHIELVHDLIEHRWGQRAVRFYDCDKHIIEVAETISAVIKRFLAQGLTPEETALRMDVPLEYVLAKAKE